METTIALTTDTPGVSLSPSLWVIIASPEWGRRCEPVYTYNGSLYAPSGASCDGRRAIYPVEESATSRDVGDLKSSRYFVFDDADAATIRKIIAAFGFRPLYVSWLVERGYAKEVGVPEKFNHLAGIGHIMNCIDWQFDHGGPSSGVRRTYRFTFGEETWEQSFECSG